VSLQYLRVSSIKQLLQNIDEPEAQILCGGTDLLVKMRSKLIQPRFLLDISEVEELRGIREGNGEIEIGAAVTESEIIASKVAERLPLLVTALLQLGSVQIRNRGTLGGNLVNASPAADSAIPLLLYDAEVMLRSAGNERRVSVEDFLRGPGKTALAPGEFLRSIAIPIPSEKFSQFLHKVGRRKALTIAIASLGALLRMEDGTVKAIRLAAGSVAPTPIRLHRVEEFLIGSKLTDSVIASARELASSAVSPIDDIRASADYRRQVIGDLLARLLRDEMEKIDSLPF
jgi:xanthine dehydrogenase FAD-binding subunit